MSASRPINLDELDRLTAATPEARDRALILLAAASGARINELAQATVRSIMKPDRSLSGILELPRKTTKGKKRSRTMQIAPRAQAALAAWLAQHPAPHLQAPLWCSLREPHQALSTRQLQRIITNAAGRAGLPGKVTAHSLRKFYGTRVYTLSQQDIAMTASALGHINPASTPRYLDLDGPRRAEILNAVLGHPSEATFGPDLPFDSAA